MCGSFTLPPVFGLYQHSHLFHGCLFHRMQLEGNRLYSFLRIYFIWAVQTVTRQTDLFRGVAQWPINAHQNRGRHLAICICMSEMTTIGELAVGRTVVNIVSRLESSCVVFVGAFRWWVGMSFCPSVSVMWWQWFHEPLERAVVLGDSARGILQRRWIGNTSQTAIREAVLLKRRPDLSSFFELK